MSVFGTMGSPTEGPRHGILYFSTLEPVCDQLNYSLLWLLYICSFTNTYCYLPSYYLVNFKDSLDNMDLTFFFLFCNVVCHKNIVNYTTLL